MGERSAGVIKGALIGKSPRDDAELKDLRLQVVRSSDEAMGCRIMGFLITPWRGR